MDNGHVAWPRLFDQSQIISERNYTRWKRSENERGASSIYRSGDNAVFVECLEGKRKRLAKENFFQPVILFLFFFCRSLVFEKVKKLKQLCCIITKRF